jgi:DNA polymerase V
MHIVLRRPAVLIHTGIRMTDSAHLLARTRPRAAPRLRIVDAAGAGFPSPAQDWEETGIDLVELLRLEQPASYVFRVSGDSMIEAGIHDRDTIVVDRDRKASNGSIVIAVCDGGFVIRELRNIRGAPHLVGRNAERGYAPRLCDDQVEIWGVARAVIRNLIGS